MNSNSLLTVILLLGISIIIIAILILTKLKDRCKKRRVKKSSEKKENFTLEENSNDEPYLVLDIFPKMKGTLHLKNIKEEYTEKLGDLLNDKFIHKVKEDWTDKILIGKFESLPEKVVINGVQVTAEKIGENEWLLAIF